MMFGDKEKKENRFVRIAEELQGSNVLQVFVDTETGVQYLHFWGPDGGGTSVLVDKNGVPMLKEELISESK